MIRRVRLNQSILNTCGQKAREAKIERVRQVLSFHSKTVIRDLILEKQIEVWFLQDHHTQTTKMLEL